MINFKLYHVFLLFIWLWLIGVLFGINITTKQYNTEHMIDMREVTEINDTGAGFEIVLEDGNYYYWKK